MSKTRFIRWVVQDSATHAVPLPWRLRRAARRTDS